MTTVGVHLHVNVTGPELGVTENQDGMWRLPPDLVDQWRSARAALDDATTAIVVWLKKDEQPIPWAFTSEAQEIKPLPADVIDGMQKAATDIIDNPPIVAGPSIPASHDPKHGFTLETLTYPPDKHVFDAVCICKEARWKDVPVGTASLDKVSALAASLDAHLIDNGQPAPDLQFYMDLLDYRPKHETPRPSPNLPAVRPSSPAPRHAHPNDPNVDDTEWMETIRDNDSPLVRTGEIPPVKDNLPAVQQHGTVHRLRDRLTGTTGTFSRVAGDPSIGTPTTDTGDGGQSSTRRRWRNKK